MRPDEQSDLAYRPSDRPRESWEWLFSPEGAAIAFVVIGLICAVGGYITLNGWGDWRQALTDFYANASSELISIGLTVLVIEQLHRRREDKQKDEDKKREEERADQAEKKSLILQMGSPDNAFAIEAVRQLRAKGWLIDGSLSRADLNGADLSGAELSGADLSGANLSGADLSEADLSRANLIAANLTNAKYEKHLHEIVSRDTSQPLVLSSQPLVSSSMFGSNFAAERFQALDDKAEWLRLQNEVEQSRTKFIRATYNSETAWPDDDFDPVAAGAILVDDNGTPIP